MTVQVERARLESIWRMPAPIIGTHLPGGAFTIDADPPPRSPIGLGQARAVHGLITELSGLGHHPTEPLFGTTRPPHPAEAGPGA